MYGIEIRNNDSMVVVDSRHQSYEFYEEGSIEVDGLTFIEFDNPTEDDPLFAFQPSDEGTCGLCYYTKSGDDFTGVYVSNGTSDSPFTIYYKVFVKGNFTATTSGVVCDVFNSAGEKVYGLDVDTMRVSYTTMITNMSEDAEIEVGSSDNYFFIDTFNYKVSYSYNDTYGKITYETIGLKKVDDNTLVMKYVLRKLDEFGSAPGSGVTTTGNKGAGQNLGRLLEIK